MESTGAKNKIHISKLLATKLIADGKEHWVMKRQDLVSAKGKGELETYWLQPNRSGENTSTTGSSTTGECFLPTKQMTANLVAKSGMPALSPKQQRLVEWNTDILTRLLRFVLTHRQAAGIKSKDSQQLLKAEKDLKAFSDRIAMDELQDVIELPHFDPGVAEDARKAKPVEVSPKVANQLREYVTVIAGLYRDNYFHSCTLLSTKQCFFLWIDLLSH